MVPRVNQRLLARWGVYPAIILGLVAVLMLTVHNSRSQHEPDDLQLVMPASRGVPNPSAKNIARWIHALGSNQKSVRKTARRQLLAAGDAAVGLLKQSRHESVSPQERQRFQSVLNDIALTDALHGPMVTFRSNNCSLHDALAAVCAQAGLGCQLPRNCKRLSEHLRMNIQHQLFWNVLLRIARVTGVSPDADYGAGLR